MAMLSNAGFDFASPFRFSPMARFFERVFISAELGMRKPFQEIYEEVAEELSITPGEMIFIDNKQENVDGAASLGILTHLFVTADGLRSFLEGLAVQTPIRPARAAFRLAAAAGRVLHLADQLLDDVLEEQHPAVVSPASSNTRARCTPERRMRGQRVLQVGGLAAPRSADGCASAAPAR